jgi:uncharacterized lipoprotein YmbA
MSPRPRALRAPGALGVAFLALAAASCSLSPREDPTRYYVLEADEPGTVAAPGAASSASVGVGPFRLPGYLDRPTFVRRVGPNEVLPEKASRWAEHLEHHVTRVMAQNLSARLPGTHARPFPWALGEEVDRIVRGEVFRFETSPDGTAELAVRWYLLDGESETELEAGLFETAVPGAGPGTAAAVAALSEALRRFADELTVAITASARPIPGSS